MVDTLGDFARRPEPHARRAGTAGHRSSRDRADGGQGFGAPDPGGAGACAARCRACTRRPGSPTSGTTWRSTADYSAVYPGVIEGLEALAGGAGCGWPASPTSRPPSRGRCCRPRAWPDFSTSVFGGDAFERKKPDPLPLLKTCEALGSPPARTLMIGDSSNDAQAARAAGCPVVLVTYGYNHGEPVRGRGCRRLSRFAGRAGRGCDQAGLLRRPAALP